MMKDIAVIGTTRKKYGGRVYEEMAAEVLSSAFDVTHIQTDARNERAGKFLKAPAVFRRLLETRKTPGFDAAVRGLEAAFVLSAPPTKNIIVVHHLDNSQRGVFLKPVYGLLERRVFRNLRKADAVVVVSGFWETYLKDRGFRNVVKIANAFDLDKFRFSEEEIKRFRETHRLTRKPIVYIGNCRKDKGVVETSKALKGLEAHLVTSGTRDVRLPATHLELSYRDYLRLLKASSVVVLMSKYKEGWNRTAHEAMLCKTPVVGPDSGGMKELLESGGQIICRNFHHLPDHVRYCLEHPEIGEKGYPFAAQFTRDRFKSAWLELMQALTADSGRCGHIDP